MTFNLIPTAYASAVTAAATTATAAGDASSKVAAAGQASGELAKQQPNGGIFFLLMIVVFIVFSYFMLFRPQQKQAQEHKKLIEGLVKGAEVVTVAGMLGTVTKLDEEFCMVRLADGVDVKIQKNAIKNVLPNGTLKSIL